MFTTSRICICFCIYICIVNSLYFPYELLLQCSGAAFRAARWLPNTDRGPWAGQHWPTILLHQGGLLPYQQAFTHHTSGRGRPTTIPANRLLPTICTRPPLGSHHILSPHWLPRRRQWALPHKYTHRPPCSRVCLPSHAVGRW